MNTKIAAEGIKVFAYHGCLEAEKKIGGEFIVDVIVNFDFIEAAKTDNLNLTVDYCTINEIVRREMAKPEKLIESVAKRIFDCLYAEIPQKCTNVKVKITKLNPPVNTQIEKVWVEIEG